MFRNVVSRLLMPQLESDLNRALSKQMVQVENMMDCMIAPTVHAFEPVASSGVFGATRQQAQRTTMKKVAYPTPGRGLFQG